MNLPLKNDSATYLGCNFGDNLQASHCITKAQAAAILRHVTPVAGGGSKDRVCETIPLQEVLRATGKRCGKILALEIAACFGWTKLIICILGCVADCHDGEQCEYLHRNADTRPLSHGSRWKSPQRSYSIDGQVSPWPDEEKKNRFLLNVTI
jgi:hypothetical protein